MLFLGFGIVVCFVIQYVFIDLFLKLVFVFVEFEVLVGGFVQSGCFFVKGGFGCDEFGRGEVGFVVFVLVIEGSVVAVFGVGICDILVSQELIVVFIVVLFLFLFFKFFVFIIKGGKKVLGGFVVYGSVCLVIDVKGNIELFKGLFVEFVVFVDNSLRGDVFFFGLDGDGSIVFVGVIYLDYIFVKQVKVVDINVSGKVCVCEVIKVQCIVGVR